MASSQTPRSPSTASQPDVVDLVEDNLLHRFFRRALPSYMDPQIPALAPLSLGASAKPSRFNMKIKLARPAATVKDLAKPPLWAPHSPENTLHTPRPIGAFTTKGWKSHSTSAPQFATERPAACPGQHRHCTIWGKHRSYFSHCTATRTLAQHMSAVLRDYIPGTKILLGCF